MSKSKILNMQDEAQNLNNLVFTDYYYRLSLLARSVFKWNNLPKHINEKWIERYLFFYGRCMFFEDPKIGLTIAQCTDTGVNRFDEPTTLTPVSINGDIEAKPYNNYKEAVLIQNNDEMIPTRNTIVLYAMRLANLQRTIDVNVNAQKTPVTIVTRDKLQTTVKKLYQQVGDNHVVIFADKELDLSSIKALKTEAPIVFPQLQIQKHAEWNEAMTFIGVNNANMDKRERLVAGEVQANNEQIELSAQVMLKSREYAAKAINELYKDKLEAPVSVEMRSAAELKKMGVNTNLEGDE